jgi:ubiquitin C-terminal hydrolase
LLKDTSQSTWLGSEKLSIILLALREVDFGFSSELSGEVVDEVMCQLINLPEDLAKRESTDTLSAMIRSLLPKNNELRLKKYYEFWLNHTLKMMNCGSIVLKLFAWDQLHEVIREAIATRPPPNRFLVRNAGTEEVNGIYTSNFKYGDVPSYEKLPTEDCDKLFTLFRCTMRSKQKWWFISVADLEKPGTDKDVDYYQHKSHMDQEMEPPTFGWGLATGSRSPSVEPPPVLCRLEPIVDSEGKSIDCLMDTLVSWSRHNKLLEKVFEQSLHREIVSRSKNLLMLLGETDNLTASDLKAIWKVGMQNGAEEIQEEVFSLLASISLHFSDSTFDVLCSLAEDCIKSGNVEKINRVVELLGHMNDEGVKYMRALSTHAKSKIIGLVWTVYKTPGVELHKCYSNIEELLSLCLRFYRKGDQVLVYLRECSDALIDYRTSTSVVDEKRISRVIRTLTFLLNQHADPGLDDVLSESGFHGVLVSELERYMALQDGQKVGAPSVISEIASRLSLIRSAYGMSGRVKMDRECLNELWKLFSDPAFREQLFVFLRNAGVKQGHMESVYSINECFYVFRSMLCSADVNWSECGDDAFQCFSVYFAGLGSRPEFDDVTKALAINTLWNMTLRLPSDMSAKEAMVLLLKAYADIGVYDPETNSELISRIFDELNAAHAGCSATGALPRPLQVCVSRCTELLSNIISKSTQALTGSKSTESNFISHAVRGNIFRIKVSVRYRVMNHQSSYSSIYNRRQSADISTFKTLIVELHPLHSLQVLKQKVNAAACALQMRVNIEFETINLTGDSYPLSHFGIVDGSEVTATLTQQSAVSSVYDDDDYNDVYYTNRSAPTKFEGGAELSLRRLSFITSESNFDCIMSLIQVLDHHDMEELSKGLWSLLMGIPTQASLLERVLVLFDSSDDNWSDMFDAQHSGRVTYILQIIDSILQPAPEIVDEELRAENTRKDKFIRTGGFGAVLRFFVTRGGDDRNGKLSLAIALHILHFCLFDSGTDSASPELISQVQESSGAVLEKLLTVAFNAALNDESGIVQNALGMITSLLQSPSIASQLTSNPKAKTLLTAVLRSASKTVRDMAAVFAVEVGKSQPVVMQWLLVELESISPGEQHCHEIFRAFSMLVKGVGEMNAEIDLSSICQTVSKKLLQFKTPETNVVLDSDRSVLLGCLELLRCLIVIDGQAVIQTELGTVLVKTFVENFLFTMPEDGRDCSPVCDTPDTRRAAFAVLEAFVKVSPQLLTEVLENLKFLTSSAALQLKNTWSLQVSHDLRRPNIQFSGLKNQGCTCYLNSLIQQLFMSRNFRDVVMKCPIRNSLRSSLWHLPDSSIIGQQFLFEWSSGEWKTGRVTEFDTASALHTIHYESLDGNVEDTVVFNIHQGRLHKETGRVKPVPKAGSVALSDRESSAVTVLEQLQRTFCFMEKSKKRYFDPRPFIESCKSLNLNFNIYHQNDASEFCDQLLDRLETAMKGKSSQIDMWRSMMEQVFGGKMLYQKIPKECDKFSVDRRDCGHWQSTRRETFLKAELIIRGKEDIEEGLAQLVEGELMDGDNKIMCDTCNQKKDTVRRTCFGKLPNLLILHLKRFDLDFTTFETVKLNNRVAFPTNISMFKYTKEGIEAEEKAESEDSEPQQQPALERRESKQESEGITDGDGNAAKQHDMLDYEYELQGVLVHSGIAQGGHYYSFIRDHDNPQNWFLFDDDDVSPFNADNIPSQCFGGSYQTSIQGVSSMIEEDRSSNALMLFYNKVRAGVSVDDDEEEEKKATTATDDSTVETPKEDSEACTNGYEAFDREVGESNHRHALTNYLVDPGLHGFVRSLIRSVYSDDAADDSESPPVSPTTRPVVSSGAINPMITVRFGTQFLLDVVLHCRERSGTKLWCDVLKRAFAAFPETATWFIKYVLGKNSAVLQEFLLHCADALSRSTFVQLIGHAVSCLCSKSWSRDCLLQYSSCSIADVVKILKTDPSDSKPLLVLVVRQVLKMLPDATCYLRTCDELFGLIRELAMFPPICALMVQLDTIAQVCYFVIPEKVPPATREAFLSASSRFTAADSKSFHSIIFEVVAALLGVPQSQKVELLNEKVNLWEPELTPEAKEALSQIFKECSHYGGMDARDIIAYMDRVHTADETAPKITTLQVRSILERYDTLADGRLSLSGFLRYYADTSMYQSKIVWKVVKYFVLCAHINNRRVDCSI